MIALRLTLCGLVLTGSLTGCPRPEAESPIARDARLEATYFEAVASMPSQASDGDYGEALRLFAEIPLDHELGLDAAAQLDWIEHGVDLRAAKAAFDAGHLRRALALAVQFDRKHEPERFDYRWRSLSQSWASQIRACRIGLEASLRGEHELVARSFAESRWSRSQALRALATAHLDAAKQGRAIDRAAWGALEAQILSLDPVWLDDVARAVDRAAWGALEAQASLDAVWPDDVAQSDELDPAPDRGPRSARPSAPQPPDGPAAWGDWNPAWERADD